MSPVLSTHPALERLAAFRVGNVTPEELSEIEGHLADCPGCCRSLKSLSDDSLVDLVRHSCAGNTLSGGDTPSGAAGRPPDAVPPALLAHPRYRVLGLLGAGGMGAVYKAEHLVMERPVALKVINRGLVDRPGVVERFRREVKAAARLSHPNIVTAFDAEQAADTHFLVMEFVEGTTLARLVWERGPLPVGSACEYARQVALGLQHAYERGMVHRDIKPHNLMLTPPGQVKILDFGLARFASELDAPGAVTDSGAVLGTADYMAPEQGDDPHRADTRADVYSLGCTLYFLLTGQPPFPEGTLVQKLKAHEQRPPRPITAFRQNVPPDLARALNRMMAKDPARRYQTPAEVVQALAPFAEAGAATEEPRDAGAPKARPRRRRSVRPLVAAAAAALVFGAALAGLVIYRVSTDQGDFIVEADDQEVQVLLAKHGLTVKDLKTDRTYHLKPGRQPLGQGDYEIDVTEPFAGLEFSTRTFTIRRGIEEKLKVSLNRTERDRKEPVGEVRRFEGHAGWVGRVVFSPDGRLAISAGHDCPRVWDMAAGKQVGKLIGQGGWGLAMSPDGKRLLCSDSTVVRLFDLADRREVRTLKGHTAGIWAALFLADGKRAVTGGEDQTLRVWDLDAGQELKPFEGVTDAVRCLALSPDGRQLAAGHFINRDSGSGLMRVWDVETGKEVRPPIRVPHIIFAMAFAADGKHVLTGDGGGGVRLWDVASGEQVRRFEGHTGPVEGVAFTPDGRVVSAGGTEDGTLRVWDAATGKQLNAFPGPRDGLLGLAVAPDGRHALTGGKDEVVRLWRLPDPPPPEKDREGRR